MNLHIFFYTIFIFSIGSTYAIYQPCDCAEKARKEMTYQFESPILSKKYTSEILRNNRGDIVWHESKDSPEKPWLFYWSMENGVEAIDLREELQVLDYKPTVSAFCNPPAFYDYSPIHLDNSGNVFLILDLKTDLKNQRARKIGVWNRSYGFKILEIHGFKDIQNCIVTNEILIVSGLDDLSHSKFSLLNNPKNFWGLPIEEPLANDIPVEVGTPWDNMPVGPLGARLYALEQLLKTKSTCQCDNMMISLIFEAEAAHVLDTLKFELKKANEQIKQAALKGKINEDAEELYRSTKQHIEALRGYLKEVSLTRSKVFSLHLPSDQWVPSITN